MGDIKTTKCVFGKCEGILAIKRTAVSKHGTSKLNATCTECGQHQMTSKGGQAILQGIVDGEEPEKPKTNEYAYEEEPKQNNADDIEQKDKAQEPKKKRGAIFLGVGAVLALCLTALSTLKIRKKSNTATPTTTEPKLYG